MGSLCSHCTHPMQHLRAALSGMPHRSHSQACRAATSLVFMAAATRHHIVVVAMSPHSTAAATSPHRTAAAMSPLSLVAATSPRRTRCLRKRHGCSMWLQLQRRGRAASLRRRFHHRRVLPVCRRFRRRRFLCSARAAYRRQQAPGWLPCPAPRPAPRPALPSAPRVASVEARRWQDLAPPSASRPMCQGWACRHHTLTWEASVGRHWQHSDRPPRLLGRAGRASSQRPSCGGRLLTCTGSASLARSID
mmetsp:Transcript_51903/g.168742  ORF Transcript_51903/g.168742 Transcript_51903/m.168742 type:complete len:249 (-) Transcript_51903:52-798(-)